MRRLSIAVLVLAVLGVTGAMVGLSEQPTLTTRKSNNAIGNLRWRNVFDAMVNRNPIQANARNSQDNTALQITAVAPPRRRHEWQANVARRYLSPRTGTSNCRRQFLHEPRRDEPR